MTSDFFETNNYFVDKRNSLHEYCQIYNDKRELIGRIKQKLNKQQCLLRLIVNKTFLPFFVEIRSANGRLEASISRRGTFLRSEIIVQDSNGKKVGVLSKKNSFFKSEFKILNTSNQVIAEICDSWNGHNFIVNDSSEKQIGSIDEKWGRSMKSVIRSTKSYNVSMIASYPNTEEKTAILSCAMVLNMFFFN